MTEYKPYKHQQETIDFYRKNPRAYDSSDMGCGKTFCIIHDINYRLNSNFKSKTLILAPKSLLETVWKNDFEKFTPHIVTSVAKAPLQNKIDAFNREAHVYITNMDTVKWLAKQPKSFWKGFETIVIDESTQIKNDSGRTKAALQIKDNFKYRRCLSGTPTAGPLTDLFYQYYFLDGGYSLGSSYYAFKNKMMISTQTGPGPNMVKWANKPGRERIVTYMVKDITIRHVLENVVDMPPTISYTYKYDLNTKSRKAYEELKREAKVTLDTGTVNAINASALTTKLLQAASGSVYDTATGTAHLVDLQRYDLVLDLVEQVPHSIVFYNWRSQREYMVEQATSRGITHTFIDGSVKNRDEIVTKFQNGEFQTIFLQLKSSSHGLTLTKATHTIWSCPSYLADYYKQANRRTYRIGQTKRTVVINIEAKNTLDGKVYKQLNTKLNSMDLLLDELK